MCKLKKGLYGLKQARRTWQSKFKSVLAQTELKAVPADECLFICRKNGALLLLLVWVDDIVAAHTDSPCGKALKNKCISHLANHFKIKSLGPLKFFLGISVVERKKKNHRWYSIHQAAFAKSIRFNMQETKYRSTPMIAKPNLSLADCPTTDEEKQEMSTIPYRSLIGSLMYLVVCTRPDMAYSVYFLARLANPGPRHWEAGKNILK